MTLLTIVQNTCQRVGVPAPSSVINNADATVQQMLALAQEQGKELTDRFHWQALTKEATFTTVAQESQGSIGTVAPGFSRLLNDTLYDRTDRTHVYGPLNAQDWQHEQGTNGTSVYDRFRIRGDLLLLYPAPAAGHQIAFEYVTKNWISGDKDAFSADEDTPLLEEELLTLGLVWRFREAKGFDYAEAFRKYEVRLANAQARDGGRPRLNMGSEFDGRAHIPTAPDGNWAL